MGKGFFKTAIIIIFSFFVVSCCHSNKHMQVSLLPSRPVAAKDAAVFIEVSGVKQDQPFMSSGTGVGIAYAADKTMILTAGHICEAVSAPDISSPEIIVRTVGARAYYSEILDISKHFDLCLLLVSEKLPIAKLAKNEPGSGDKVFYSGYPTGFYSPGVLHHFEGYMAGKDMVGDHMYNIPAIGGSSGSPVYNEKGEIVGILSAVMVDFHWMTFAVGTENVRDFMSDFHYEIK